MAKLAPDAAEAAALDSIERRVAEVTRAVELGAWRAQVEGARAGDDAAPARLLALARDAALTARLAAWAAGAADGAFARRALMLATRLERVRLAAVGAREAAAAARGASGAAEAASWLECLRADPLRARREEAWRARVAAASAPAGLVAAAAARRRERDYAARLVAAHRLTWAEIERVAASEAARSEAPWRVARAARAAALGVDELRPWDLHVGPPERAAISAALAATGAYAALARDAAALGFPAAAPARLDVPLARAGGAAATTYFIDAPLDVRIVADEPGGEWSDWLRLAHELGHARYAASHAPSLPWSLRDAPAPWLHEAVAQAFALRPTRAAWLREHAYLPAPLADALAAHAAFERLLETRLRLVHLAFERHLLDATAGPVDVTALSQRWWSLMHDLVGVSDPAHAPSWARIPHFLSRPGSSFVYLVADAVADRLGDGVAKFTFGLEVLEITTTPTDPSAPRG